MIQITEKSKKEIEEKFTKYEIARILGARALQIAMNAPILIKLSEEELEKIRYDPLKIAEIEFYAGILPITVKRPLPKKAEEKEIKKQIIEEKVEEKKRGEKGRGRKEKVKEGEEKPKEEGKIAESEKKAEEKPGEKPREGTLEEVEQSEIMEMAVPVDEAEEEAPTEEESE